MAFNQNQPRDREGKWSDTGAGRAARSRAIEKFSKKAPAVTRSNYQEGEEVMIVGHKLRGFGKKAILSSAPDRSADFFGISGRKGKHFGYYHGSDLRKLYND